MHAPHRVRLLVVAGAASLLACRPEPAPVAETRADAGALVSVPESEGAARLLDRVRAFQVPPPSAPDELLFVDPRAGHRPARPLGPALAPSPVERVEIDGLALRPRLASPSAAQVTLPAHADGAFRVADAASGLSVSVSLDGALHAAAEVASGYVVYPSAAAGDVSLVHRVHAEGTEDFLLLPRRPDGGAAVRYTIEPGRGVAGLRLVGGTLELIDEGGAPRLRVSPPFLLGQDGERRAATISVEGCAYDRDPAAPWGRAPVAPGAARCGVVVAWDDAGLAYPALLDPSWTLTGSMSVTRYQHTATLLQNGKVLVAGGMPNVWNTAEIYDPMTGLFAATGNLNTGRYQQTATLLGNGKVLVAGGSVTANTSRGTKSAELYDPMTGKWTAMPDMASARYWHTANLLGSGKVLLAGGADDSGLIVATAELFDPTNNTWSSTGSLNHYRFVHGSNVLQNGMVLVDGGYSDVGGPSTSCELYDPTKGTWTDTGSMSQIRQAHTSTLLANGKVLVVGGGYFDFMLGKNVFTAVTELYDPMTGMWTNTANISTGRFYHTATRLGNNTVLVAGGYNGTTLNNADLYDPAQATWTATAPMNRIRANHTATLLQGGSVLAAGGSTNTAELYLSAAPNGSACTKNGDCASGFCVDGFCCNAACTDQCAACNVKGSEGKCLAVTGTPVGGRAACTNAGTTCGGACDGMNTAACAYPGAMTACGAAPSCANGVATLATACDGVGNCAKAKTQVCDPYVCGATACKTTCTVNADCIANSTCDNTKHCTGTLANGAPCTAAAQCKSLFCVDGFCCNAACTGQCAACNVKGVEGTCSPTPKGQAPAGTRAACATDGTSCGGTCDGMNTTACAYPGMNTSCRAAACANGVATGPASCDGMGNCPAGQATKCSPFVCGNNVCLTQCQKDADCIQGYFCGANNQCTPQLGIGSMCTGNGQCHSNFCVDGFCCDSACGDQCAACNVKGNEGTCSPVPMGGSPVGMRMPCATDGSNCGGVCDGMNTAACAFPDKTVPCRSASCMNDTFTAAANCNGMGACSGAQVSLCTPFTCGMGGCLATCMTDMDCAKGYSCMGMQCVPKLGNGTMCTMGAQCMTGFCVDGVCCDSACTAQCAACNLMGSVGSCSLVPAMMQPVGMRMPCATDGSACGGACDGMSPVCAYPGNNVTCHDAACANGVATVATSCDGKGACPPAQTVMCAPFVCSGVGCASTCMMDSDCVDGFYCDAGACVMKKAKAASCMGNGQCTSGFCVDGVCCDTACTDQCAACNVMGMEGTCSPVKGTPVGTRTACAGGDACKGMCDGTNTSACAFPGPNTQCKPAACESGVATAASTCDGKGGCTAGATTTCDNGCAADNVSCAEGDLATGPDMGSAMAFAGGGCGCRVTSRATSSTGPMLIAFAFPLLLASRRRRRRSGAR